MNRASAPWCLALVVLFSCGRAQTGVQPATFDRANAVAFTCFDKEDGILVPLDEACGTIDADARYATIALVAQSARGQVAAVDLAAGRVLDINPSVPGFSFYVVLPMPSALAVRPDQPTFTYVASFGASAVQAIPTDRMVPGAHPSGATPHQVPLPGPPTDLVLAPDGNSLLVAVPETRIDPVAPTDAGIPMDAMMPLPDATVGFDAALDGAPATDAEAGDAEAGDAEAGDAGMADTGPVDGGPTDGEGEFGAAGAVFMIPLDAEGHMGSPVRLDFHAAVAPPDLRDLPELPPSADVTFAEHACIPEPITPPAPPANPPPPATLADASMERAHPVALEVDPFTDVLLVADDRLPLIHRIDLSAEPPQPLEPIAVGVPTRMLALSPPVPLRPGEDATAARYLFAIDDREESVLVVDYTEGSPSEGAVLPVSSSGFRPDRLLLPQGVSAIGILTPQYDAMRPDAPGERCTPGSELEEAAAATALRGVFLAAGLSDGTLRIVDVHDLDLECRGYPGCAGLAADQSVFWRRHAPRIQQAPSVHFILTAAPLFRFRGASSRVAPDGSMETGEAPGLVPLDECPEGMRTAFPLDGPAPLVCAVADPWALRAQRWMSVWQGPIPGSFTAGFVRQDDSLEVPGGALCARGVVGSEDPPSHLPAYAGDVLEFVAPVDEPVPPGCGPLEDVEGRNLAFRIRSVRQTGMELGEPLGEFTLDDVRRCFTQPVAFRVRTSDAYTVTGSVSGFLHRRTAAEDGTCVDDPTRDPLLRGRAVEGSPFRSAQIAFHIQSIDGEEPTATLELQLDVGGASTPHTVQLGVRANATVPVLPAAIEFNPILGRLYVVDRANRGLMELDPQPLRITRPFE
jgi:hypothetical protein